jgi:subtilisin family serine protease/subtilisin-like proprotein convertase family protein
MASALKVGSGLVAALALLAVPAPVSAAPPEGTVLATGGPTAIDNSYIVVLKQNTDRATLAARFDGTVTRTYRHALHGFEATLTDKAARRLAADPNVASVTQNHTVSITDTQTPTTSWGLDRVDQRALPLDNTFTYPRVAPNVRAYVLDTGIRFSHTDLGGRAVSGYDIIDDDPDAADCQGHGTHVAGTIGGNTYGVAKNVQLVSVRVLGCRGEGTIGTVIGGVDWVTADHTTGQPAVANMSLGGGAWEPFVRAVTNSIADGITYAVAAGNDNGTDACTRSPANTPDAITVAATRPDDSRAPFSNIGPCVDIFAPGTDIVSAGHADDTAVRTASGTSMAAPHVAGAAALILADHPTYKPGQVADELFADSTPGIVTDAGTGSANRLLHVDPTVPTDDFSLTAAPAAGTVTAGNTLTTTIQANVVSGAPQPVNLATSGLPSGATATFSPATVGSGDSSTLTIATSATTPSGSYPVIVTGTGPQATRLTTFRLTVAGAPGCVGGNATETALPVGNTVEVPVTITGCAGNAARNSTVEVHIPHDGVGDLDARLVAPDGTEYQLVYRTGGDIDGLHYTFTHNLSSEPANGTWKLRVQDGGSAGSGHLASWALNVAGQDLPVPTCGGLDTTRIAVPDRGSAESTMTVRGCGRPPSSIVFVELGLTHQWVGDLRFYLVAPDGHEVQMWSINGPGPNLRGTLIADMSRSPANGVWRLRVEDISWGTEGTLDNWKLTL